MDNNEKTRETGENPQTASAAEVEANINGEYDPFAARSVTQPNSDLVVFMHLLKAAIGSGILFLPHAFRLAGYVTALTCSVVIGMISAYTAILIVQCSHILCKRLKKPSLDLAETISSSFMFGPQRFRKYAGHMNIFTNVLVCFIQYETAIIYSIYIGTSVEQIIENLFNASLNIRIYILMFLPIYLALGLIPNFKYLLPCSILGSIFLGLGLSITLYYFFSDFPSPGRLETYTGIPYIPVYCSILLFAVHNMTVIMPLENSMKNPQNMPRVLFTSMTLNTCIYMAFGFFGYNKYLDACDTVIKNLSIDDAAAVFVKIVVTLSVMCTYGLHYYVPISILWPMIKQASERAKSHPRLYEILFRLGGVTATTLFAAAIPQMTPVLGFLTALSMTTTMLLLPVTVELLTKWQDQEYRIFFYLRCIKASLITFLWFILFVFGSSENLREIIMAFHNGNSNDTC